MIKIESDWSIQVDNNGNSFPMFNLFMTRDNDVTFNCAMNAAIMMKDGDAFLDTLTIMVTNLVQSCYPEMKDPLYRMKKELSLLEERIADVKKYIKTTEEARESDANTVS